MQDITSDLIDLFGKRVAFHKIERRLYSCDINPLPGVIKTFINSYPDAVVQPESSTELTALFELCLKYDIPVVPRGSGTSGYGGCVPTRGGIVVDFYRMNKIIEINREKRTVIVQPGTVWRKLEEKLRSYGMALRLYPSSAISSTVGGWIANGGGAGIGSFEYGCIGDNVLEIELVTPKGIRKVNNDELNLISGMCGTTGFISGIVLEVRDIEDDKPVLAAFPGFDDLQNVFTAIKSKKLALWHVSCKNQIQIKLTRIAIEEQAAKAPLPYKVKEPELPGDKLLAMFVYPESREETTREELLSIIKANRGEVLSSELAKFEWEERFYPMRMKAIGPSLVASEVVIPAQNIATRINAIKISDTAALDITLINNGTEALVLQYEPDDERRFGFPLKMPVQLIPLVAGSKFNSRPYTIGMLLTGYAGQMFGDSTLLKAFKFKKEIDPSNIINPGKVFPGRLDKRSPVKGIELLVKLTGGLTGLVRIIDKYFGGKPSRKVSAGRNILGKLPFGKNALWDAFTCTGCGYCRTECPQFNAVGWESASSRGKFTFLKEYSRGNLDLDERMAEMFYTCTTCEQCNVICQVKSRIEDDWALVVKPAILHKGFAPPEVTLKQAGNIFTGNNNAGKPQGQRAQWITPDLRYSEEGEIGYFAGCQVSFNYNFRNLPINAFRILNKAGIEPVYLGTTEWCCGATLFYTGFTDEVMGKIEHNLNEFNKRGIKTLITSCAGCLANLAHYYPIWATRLNLKFDIKVMHIVEYLSELIKVGTITPALPVDIKITYHDPCHLGRARGIYQPPRDMLQAIPGIQMVEMPRNREHSACCGRHIMRYPALGKIINSDRVNEVLETDVSAVVSACPTCETNLRLGLESIGSHVDVIDLSDLLAWSMGLPIPAVSTLPRLLHTCGVREVGREFKMPVLLTEKERIRENHLFAPDNNSYDKLAGIRLDLASFMEQEQKAAEAAKSGKPQGGNKPDIYIPPTC